MVLFPLEANGQDHAKVRAAHARAQAVTVGFEPPDVVVVSRIPLEVSVTLLTLLEQVMREATSFSRADRRGGGAAR